MRLIATRIDLSGFLLKSREPRSNVIGYTTEMRVREIGNRVDIDRWLNGEAFQEISASPVS